MGGQQPPYVVLWPLPGKPSLKTKAPRPLLTPTLLDLHCPLA